MSNKKNENINNKYFRENSRKYEGKLIGQDAPFGITEAFKMIRTNLIYSTSSEGCPVFAVTSAYANTGKSVIISNIAMSFAQLDKKVLLIDGDMRRPTVHKIFSTDNNGGLSEIILGVDKDAKYSDYLRDTPNSNFKIITSGHVPLNPSELLSSIQFEKFINEMRNNFDCIFIDLPPIGVVSDAGIVAKHISGYLIVVRSGQTEYRTIDNAIESLNQTKANILGFILNEVNPKINKYKKGYSRYDRYDRN